MTKDYSTSKKGSFFAINRLKICFASLFLLSLSTSCIKTDYYGGYAFKQQKLEQVTLGQSQTEVLSILGSPSAKSTFGSETWYYVSTEYQSIAFLNPKIISQKVLALKFDSQANLDDIKEYSEKDALNIKYSKEVTPTEGHDLSVMQQLLGNVGRFSGDHHNSIGP